MSEPERPIQTIADLKLDEDNPRLHPARNQAMLVDSLHETGAWRSIAIDEHGNILAGNGVVEAAAEAGIERVKVVEADGEEIVAVMRRGLSDEAKLRYKYLDNRTAELAEWDVQAIKAHQEAGLDLGGVFRPEELEKLLRQAEREGRSSEETPPDEDELPAVEEVESRCRPGDLWELPSRSGLPHRVLVGDATQPESYDRLLAGRPAGLCFTSPPYNLGDSVGLRQGRFHGQDTAYTDTDDDDDVTNWWALMTGFTDAVLPHCAVLAVNVQLLARNKERLAAWVGRYGEHLIDCCVWTKTNPPPMIVERACTSAFEFIWLLSPKKSPTRTVETACFSQGSFSNVYTSAVGNNSHTAGKHGATMPMDMAKHFVGHLSQRASTVLDPFLGTGTTILAAESLGRRGMGIERDARYMDLCLKRYELAYQVEAVRVESGDAP